MKRISTILAILFFSIPVYTMDQKPQPQPFSKLFQLITPANAAAITQRSTNNLTITVMLVGKNSTIRPKEEVLKTPRVIKKPIPAIVLTPDYTLPIKKRTTTQNSRMYLLPPKKLYGKKKHRTS